MVDLKKAKYELNHLYRMRINQQEMVIGAELDTSTDELELFAKSLALAGDLKKLPIIRGLHGNFSFHGNLPGRMNASGFTGLTSQLIIWNGEAIDDNIIAQIQAYATQNAGILNVMSRPVLTWDFEGGVLAMDTLRFELGTSSNAAVAGAAFIELTVSFNGFVEIDWLPVSRDEFKDFILESVYSEQ